MVQMPDSVTQHAPARHLMSDSPAPGARLPTHLKRLEAESIEIMREVVAEFKNPVMLYSIGKDSSVMLHLAIKAFYPSPLPFPLLHVDTTWKFREMKHDARILADRVEHHRILELGDDLAHDLDRLGLEAPQVRGGFVVLGSGGMRLVAAFGKFVHEVLNLLRRSRQRVLIAPKRSRAATVK